MARSRGASDGWRSCLHWGLIGCSGLVAVVFLVIAASLCSYLLVQARSQDVEKLTGRPTPVRPVEHGGVAVIRLPGYLHTEACILPGGTVLVVGQPVPSVAMVLGVMPNMLRDFGGTLAKATHRMDSRLFILSPRDLRAHEFPLPLPDDALRSSVEWCLNRLTGHVAVHVSVSPMPSLLAEDFERPVADEIWVAGPPSWAWGRWLSAPSSRDLRPAIWLPDGSALLCLMKSQSSQEGYQLCLLRSQGQVEPVATVPSPPPSTLGFSKGGNDVILVYEGSEEGGEDGRRRVLWVDLRTGRTDERRGPSTDKPTPGPRRPGEVLLARRGLRALNARTGADRCVTQWDGPVLTVRVLPCPDPRWALVGLWDPQRQTSVVAACDLCDGGLRALARAPNVRLLAVASDGRRALLAVSDQLQSVPFPDASASHLADVHLDWKAIKAAPGTADPRRLFPGDDGMVRDGHRGARAGERGAVAPDRPVEQAPSARPEPVH